MAALRVTLDYAPPSTFSPRKRWFFGVSSLVMVFCASLLHWYVNGLAIRTPHYLLFDPWWLASDDSAWVFKLLAFILAGLGLVMPNQRRLPCLLAMVAVISLEAFYSLD